MPFKFFTVLICFCVSFYARSQAVPAYSVTLVTEQSTGHYFVTAAHPGNVSTHSVSYNMILENNGDLLYFKKFVGEAKSGDFKLLPNGLISYFSKDKFYLMDKAFKLVDSVYCKNGISTDRHELKLLKDGHFLLLGSEEILINLSAHQIFKPNNAAGSPNTTVTCGVLQELDAKKNVVFEWHSKDYFKFKDMDTFYLADPKKLDWTHCNAAEQDQDGNFLLSVRNFSEITKINRKDSSIIWRLGGARNQFTFKNDPDKFKGQHDVISLANGNITLFDNGRAYAPFHPATAKEYSLDEKTLTATLVWKFVNDSNAYSSSGLGNVQRLADGSTLINYGSSNKSRTLFSVLSPLGEKYFEMFFKDNRRSYRVFNYKDLKFAVKRPAIKTFKKNGQLYLDAGKGYSAYLWSNGASTRIIPAKANAVYFVGVPANDGGYIVSPPYTTEEKSKK